MRYNPTIAGIVNTIEMVVIALVLAFVFRAFVAEAFRIPTGSMAETLRGAHYHLRCSRCGYKYDFGSDQYPIETPHCVNCGRTDGTEQSVALSNGDRILVLKCIYQFADPQRWDVVVFKNPLNPIESYIKRMIAVPGETVEIIDGDIYINGKIVTKPPKVQEEFWTLIYDNDYPPIRGRPKDNKNYPAAQPFRNYRQSNWNLSAKGPGVFSLDSPTEEINTIYYDTSIGNNFRAAYGYNNSSEHHHRPVCSDLMLRFYVAPGGKQGRIGAVLKKYDTWYRGSVNFDGEMIIEKIQGGGTVEFGRRKIKPVDIAEPVLFRFSNVDHQLVLEFGDERLKCELGRSVGDVGQIKEPRNGQVRILGSGKLSLSHIALYRDMHYINSAILRAGRGQAFTLGRDEFFVCGDNSPHSLDGRLWAVAGIGNNGVRYTMGVVPRDYLVGKAFFIYWGDAFGPFKGFPPVIPNISRLGFIYGGSAEKF